MLKKYNFLNSEKKIEIENIIKKTKQFINENLIPIIKNIDEKLEGNIFMFHQTTTYTNEFFDKQVNFILASQKSNTTDILEIGFNAGFSALLMLFSSKTINITCVDICEHKYTQLCYNKIKEVFGERINLISGSSTIVLPTLLDKTYDLIHIDGCHLVNIAEQDIRNSLKLCKSGTILIMDDTERDDLSNLWKTYVNKYKLLSFLPNNFIETKYHNIKVYK
jgi:predicted O-methyltransferase YrrM